MPCMCGNKVERHESNKILCTLCQQFVHWKCLNIEEKEVELIEVNFKCPSCLSARRSSLSNSPIVLSPNRGPSLTAESNIKSNQIGNNLNDARPQLRAKTTSSAPNKLTSAHKSAVSPDPQLSTKTATAAAKKSTSQKAAVSLESQAVQSPAANSVSMTLIYNELIALKHNNQYLTNLVKQLAEDNCVLTKKVVELQETVSSVKSNTESYPNFQQFVHAMGESTILYENNNAVKVNSMNDTSPKRQRGKVVAPARTVNVSAKVDKPHSDVTAPSAILPSTSTLNPPNKEVPSKFSYAGITKAATAACGVEPTPTIVKDVFSNRDAVMQNYNNSITNANKVSAKVDNDKKMIPLVGINDNFELAVRSRKKWLHLSSFRNDVKSDDIIAYIVKHTGISAPHFECYSLTKKGVVAQTLKFVNFKLGVSAVFYDKVFNAQLWNANVKIRPFRFLDKVPSQNVDQALATPVTLIK